MDIILAGDVSRGQPVNAAQVSVGNGQLMITADGTMAGFQISVSGDFALMDNSPDGWQISGSQSTLLGVDLTGHHSLTDLVLEYEGELEVSVALIADWFGNVSTAENRIIPEDYHLEKVWPNPFNPVANIQFGLPQNAEMSITVYDLTGRKVAEVIETPTVFSAGSHQVQWDAGDQSSGIYILIWRSGEFQASKKVLLLK